MARRRLEEGVVIARVQGEVDLQGDDHSRCKMSVVYFASSDAIVLCSLMDCHM